MNRKKNPKSNIMELWKPENSLSLSLPFCIFTSLSLSFYFCCWILKIFFQYNFKHKRNESWMKWMDQRQKQKKKIFSQIKYTERDYSWKHFPKWWKYRRYFFFGFYSNQNNNQTKQQKKISTNFIAWRFISAVLHIYTVILCSVLFCSVFSYFFFLPNLNWMKKKEKGKTTTTTTTTNDDDDDHHHYHHQQYCCMYVCMYSESHTKFSLNDDDDDWKKKNATTTLTANKTKNPLNRIHLPL